MNLSKKDEDSGDLGIFYHLDKTTVLQEARVFNETPIVPRKCRLLLTKIIYLLYIGEPMATTEATELFFSVTKLFQSKDIALRQMVYLVIKELSSIAEDVIMVTSSLMKDMQPKSDVIYRANAIRALCKITDASMLPSVERFLKAAVVDKTPSISSAAIVSSYHLFPAGKDVIKRWANEVHEAINSKPASLVGSASSYLTSFSTSSSSYNTPPSSSNINQYHALGLLYLIRQHDRMAVTKLIQQLAGSSRGGFGSSSGILRNTFAYCLLIRFAAKILDEDPNSRQPMYDLLEGWLRHKSDIVNFEAAKAICNIKDVTSKELYPAINVLQLFLSSPRFTLRFAAIRTLNKLAMTHPTAVQPCNLDMENLITDQNRSVATFAITTLLKTGNEASVDRLMKQITGFMSEISDEFKVIVVDAIRSLCLKFPTKQAVMLGFLSGVLRDEGGYEFKRAVVEAIFDLVKFIPESKEAALAHLCEFIEDCEFTKLSVRVLHLLGVEGPKTATPTKYIRYIYNRVILENSIVRAAAVSALAKFGVSVEDPEVKKSIKVLLTRCLDDNDDEVRDRATLYLRLLDEDENAEKYLKDDSTYSLAALERQLVQYVSSSESAEKPFDLSAIPKITKSQAEAENLRPRSFDLATQTIGVSSPAVSGIIPATISTASRDATPTPGIDQQQLYTQQLEKIPEIAAFGTLFKSSVKPVELTESETEYVVSCVKHVFNEHIVFQFNINNTLNDQLLENVSVVMQPESDDIGLEEEFVIPASKLAYDQPGSVYVAFKRTNLDECPLGSFSNTLKFVVKDCDPTSGEPDEEGYEDEYLVEDVELVTGDYVLPTYISDFQGAWDKLGEDGQVVETFALTASKSLKAACTTLIELLGMSAVENTGTPQSSSVHTLLLSGIFFGGVEVLAKSRMTFSPSTGVTMELSVRSSSQEISRTVISAVV
ncbi:Coatomer, gamma subunit [Gigaspora margarita]|uniref:Coatomer subunit gamma n=1 Tax=Gigaspora margarita TaxID=4874 RepID=A0A8H4AEI4_GIGMA|nr:Coatomer, gamma subunit [Gigaspora margarita]